MYKKRMDKRGQFFIIAAVLIVVVLFGLSNVATYVVVKPEPRSIKEVSAELYRETYNIIEYGIYNETNLTQLADSYIGDDVAKYYLKKSNDANIVYVYGNRSNLQALHYRNADQGTINIGGTNFNVFNPFSKIIDIEVTGNDPVEVEILGKSYLFEIRDNEMFYFVIVQQRGEETFVERDEESKNPGFTNRPGK